ncbi:hypothetical protein SAMN05518801_12039 [Novosphingobium sp. CF614]|nr:hypothetical protein SAMN05518801_12039 [Novosphingobium sp. CF614]
MQAELGSNLSLGFFIPPSGQEDHAAFRWQGVQCRQCTIHFIGSKGDPLGVWIVSGEFEKSCLTRSGHAPFPAAPVGSQVDCHSVKIGSGAAKVADIRLCPELYIGVMQSIFRGFTGTQMGRKPVQQMGIFRLQSRQKSGSRCWTGSFHWRISLAGPIGITRGLTFSHR